MSFLIFVLVYLISGIILQTKGIEMAFYQCPNPRWDGGADREEIG